MMWDLFRLNFLMSAMSRIDWLQNKLRIVNTGPPSEGKMSRISYLMDLTTELELGIPHTTPPTEYSLGLREFKKQAEAAYNKMAGPD
jgi:hypothetical protein